MWFTCDHDEGTQQIAGCSQQLWSPVEKSTQGQDSHGERPGRKRGRTKTELEFCQPLISLRWISGRAWHLGVLTWRIVGNWVKIRVQLKSHNDYIHLWIPTVYTSVHTEAYYSVLFLNTSALQKKTFKINQTKLRWMTVVIASDNHNGRICCDIWLS